MGLGCRMHPPSGVAIILQTERHALQTADKETVVTTEASKAERVRERKERKKAKE